jgi:hypothetical protein
MVKINDFSDVSVNDSLPWNMVEDLCIYMKNDQKFYRSNFYPALLKVQETVKNGGKYSKKEMLPVVEKAIVNYIQKFNIKKRPEELMQDNEKMECINRILKDEMENFRKGMY